MRTKFIITLVLALITCLSANAKGILPVIYSNGEDIVKVVDLPQSEEYTITDDDGTVYHADLGIMHKQFSLFWIPLFNYGTEQYVLFCDQDVDGYDYIYADLSSSDIEYLQSEIGGIPAEPELPFWHAWGGKLLALAIIGVIVFFAFFMKSDEEESEQAEKSATQMS